MNKDISIKIIFDEFANIQQYGNYIQLKYWIQIGKYHTTKIYFKEKKLEE